MSRATLDEIIDLLWIHPEHSEWRPKVEMIPLEQIKEWMKSSDMEVLGFVRSTIWGRRFRIEPDLSLDDYMPFFKLYYGRCFRESPDGEWSDSRWSAGSELVNVLSSLWHSESVPRQVLDEWKNWLADLYKESSPEIRTCIVQATLEHLLEQKAFRKYFADWKDDPILKNVYQEALEWYQGGGRTPLGKPPRIK